MAGYPTVFANLAAGNEPLSLFDTMFNVVGQQGNIPCTASGTNAITLTPSTNYYSPAAYTIAQIASFKAVATSTGSVTIAIGGLSLIKLFTAAGVQAASGDVVLNTHYEVQYWADLDSGNGGFIILNATVTAIANPVSSEFKNLKITNGATPNTQVALTADAVVVQNAGGGTARITSVNVTISTASTGANALDTGTVANSTWYFVYAIFNSAASTTAGLLSLSSTAPTLPSGYTYFARLGAVSTDGSALLYRTLQLGRDAQFQITAATNTVVAPNIANGAAGSYSNTSPTLVSATVAGNGHPVPTTASKIKIVIFTSYQANTPANVLLAPSFAYSGTNNGPGGSVGMAYPGWLGANSSMVVDMVLEATTVYWASTGSGGAISCLGWTDNI